MSTGSRVFLVKGANDARRDPTGGEGDQHRERVEVDCSRMDGRSDDVPVYLQNEDRTSARSEIMLGVDAGRISSAVLDVGGLLGIGNRLLATPWPMLTLDADDHAFALKVSKERLKNVPTGRSAAGGTPRAAASQPPGCTRRSPGRSQRRRGCPGNRSLG